MSYTTDYNPNTAGSTIGGLASAANQMTEGELQRIAGRIHRMTDSMNGIANQLCDHADAVHGSPPPPVVGNSVQPVRSGLIGSIHDALDRLENAHSNLAEQAGRNCTLA